MAHRSRMAPEKLVFARRMRKRPTVSEALLWERLRREQLGWKFVRQARMLGYIVDFYAPQAGLVVEVDGLIHDDPEVRANDEYRTSVLERHGYRIVRVAAATVENDMDAALDAIRARLAEQPTPIPNVWRESRP